MFEKFKIFVMALMAFSAVANAVMVLRPHEGCTVPLLELALNLLVIQRLWLDTTAGSRFQLFTSAIAKLSLRTTRTSLTKLIFKPAAIQRPLT
jgi:hypothetical protein